ncbi:MAG TPA: hypothetical protein VM264_12525, partial [Acidimicrobiales bacterium]|nr:hypothetical protein [Acidimicrobiales bacterium]
MPEPDHPSALPPPLMLAAASLTLPSTGVRRRGRAVVTSDGRNRRDRFRVRPGYPAIGAVGPAGGAVIVVLGGG